MRDELDALLCEKYPKMMVNRDKSMMGTCMCWGFECGDGWFNIIDRLMHNIQDHIDWKNRDSEVVPQVTLDQVKEKFGTLRFYVHGGDDVTFWMIRLAEHYSERTCEGCGIPSKVSSRDGWLSNVCPVCMDLREQERAQYAKENGFEL